MNKRDQPSNNDLLVHWFIVLAVTLSVAGYVFACQYLGTELQIGVEESQRVFIRTVFYVIAIVLFPFTTLLRHILLRLNQTMPGETSAAQRYLLTVVVTQGLVEIVGIFGLLMFILGDDYNTLYIFSTMAALGIFLHRPRLSELIGIHQRLVEK